MTESWIVSISSSSADSAGKKVSVIASRIR
jgi:hypothetical protein